MDLSNFKKDISDLSAALSQGLESQIYGSFSDRNPALGKMTRCVFCRTRRRQFAVEVCCNASHATTQRAWDAEMGFYQVECPPRVNEETLSKQIFKRFTHKRHGQNRDWRRKQITSLMQNDFHFVEKAAHDMFSRPKHKQCDIQKMLPTAAEIPVFAEKYHNWLIKYESRRIKQQRKTSRRINLGLISGLKG